MKVEPIPIAKLKPAPYNPRTLSDERRKDLQRSLEEFGLVEPLVWNKQTGHVVGGNQRLMLLKESGRKKIDCAVVDLPLKREKLLNLRLNKTSGEWDAPALSEMLKELDPADWGLTGFDDIEIKPLVFDAPVIEDDVPDPPKKATTKPGDLWKLGEHRVLCGDATKGEDVTRVMGGMDIDALVTDPPYSSGGQFRSDRTRTTSEKYVQTGQKSTRTNFAGDNRDQRAFLAWASSWLGDAFARSKPGSVAIVFTDWRQLPTVSDAVQCGGWVWRNIVTWWKPGCRMQRGRFSLSAEYLVVASNGKPAEGAESPQNVLEAATRTGDKSHIAEKPVELLAAVLGVTKSGAVIYDPFLGSGTTLIAAEQLGRKCYGLEIEPKYCDVIVERWQNLTGKKAKRA